MKKISEQYLTPEQSPGFLLWQVTHLWQRKINVVLKQFDLTHMQFVLLANIAWYSTHNQSLTQVQLAEKTKIQVMLVSQVVKMLEKKSLISRKQSEADTRAKTICITDLGFDKAQQAIKVVEAVDTYFFNVSKEREKIFIELLQELSK